MFWMSANRLSKSFETSNRIAASQKIRHSFCHCFFRFYQYMTVGIRRYHIAVMAQPLLHLLERCSIFEQQRSTRMTQVMEADSNVNCSSQANLQSSAKYISG